MIESLRSLTMFATVVEEGSYQAAANRLNVSATLISQKTKGLEERSNCILLDRSSREIKPTNRGRKLLEPVPTMLSGGVLSSIVEDFLLAHPKVQMELRFENVQRHPIHDDVDLTIGINQLNHKSIVHRDLFGDGAGFYAAPDLAERIERLEPREVLTKIPLLMCYGFGSAQWAQAFLSETQVLMTDIPFRMKCDDVMILYRMGLSGAGLAVLPHSLVSEDVKRGRFVQVLKHLSLEHTHFLALWNKESANVAIVESFLDHTEFVLAHVRRRAPRD